MSNVKPATFPDIDPAEPFAIAGFGLTLRDAIAPDRHLRAHCACGRHGPVYTGYWMSRGWGDKPIIGLVDHVRCCCGARLVELVIANGPEWPGDSFYVPA